MKVKVFLLLILVLELAIPVSGQKKGKSSAKITVSGTVTGLDKRPIEGAIIFLDTLYTKTVTDELGKYRIKTDQSTKTIYAVIMDKGFGRCDLNENSNADITVNMDATKMPGFLSRQLMENKKRIARVHRMNTYPNIYEMIRAEVPGVTVTGTNITIKQGHSFFGSSTPLFIVDGVKVPSIDYINPTQVKKIEFFTGSQALIYSGVDGSTGVLKITLMTGADK
ncbi:MAG: TonB-dependent receptor plug domain-containing protein [Bacteroidales bacterium]|jgi:hypothetical protein